MNAAEFAPLFVLQFFRLSAVAGDAASTPALMKGAAGRRQVASVQLSVETTTPKDVARGSWMAAGACRARIVCYSQT